MSKKTPIDMTSLLATKGQGVPANDAPTPPVIKETRSDELTKSRNKDTI